MDLLIHPIFIQLILQDFPDVFSKPKGLPPVRSQDHRIILTPGFSPVRMRRYRYPHFQKAEINRSVNAMLQDGIIQPSKSPHSSPVILVKKKDGSWCFCVNYRALNTITVNDRFPIPIIDELFDELHGSRFYSKIHLRSGFHQILLSKESIEATAFCTNDGHYEFLVMPFGITNAPSTFQATMNHIFKPLLHRFVLVFLYDILIYTTDWDTHLQHIRQTLQLLHDHSLVAKLSKCEFGLTTISYLGHTVSSAGIKVDSSKITALVDWPIPTTTRALRGFLSLAGYYRHFVK